MVGQTGFEPGTPKSPVRRSITGVPGNPYGTGTLLPPSSNEANRTMKPIEVKLTIGKETKETYRYEIAEPDAVVSTLYVRKSAVGEGKPPPGRLGSWLGRCRGKE
jgi:hypothetical protein